MPWPFRRTKPTSGARPLPSAPNYDRDPVFGDARRACADYLSVGAPVTMPREVANYAENILVRLLASEDAVRIIGYHHDALMVAGCRQAISDAIAASDREHGGIAGE